MIRNTLRALAFSVVTLLGAFLLACYRTRKRRGGSSAPWRWSSRARCSCCTAAARRLSAEGTVEAGPEMRLADTTPAAAATAEIEAPMVDGSGGGSMAVGETVAAVMAGETAAGTDPLR